MVGNVKLDSEAVLYVNLCLKVCLGNAEDGYLFESRREKCGCLSFFSVDSSPNINSQALQVIFANCY